MTFSRETPFRECISCSEVMIGIRCYSARKECVECGGKPVRDTGRKKRESEAEGV